MMRPVRSSRAATLRTGTPSDMPRMTTVSVCVPTASAMYTTAGTKTASSTSARSSSSNEATIAAESIAPASPSASHGNRCHNRLGTASTDARSAAGERAPESREILLVLVEQDADQRLGRHEARECAVRVDDRDRSYAPLRRERGGVLPVDVLCDHDGLASGELADRARRVGLQERLERDDPEEALAVDDGDVGGAVEGSREEPPSYVACRLRRIGSGHVADDQLGHWLCQFGGTDLARHRAEGPRHDSDRSEFAQSRRDVECGEDAGGAALRVDDDEVRRSVLCHQLCGALERLLGRDRESLGRGRRSRRLVLEVADARRRHEIEVGHETPEQVAVLTVVGHDDAVNAMGGHQLPDAGQRGIP